MPAIPCLLFIVISLALTVNGQLNPLGRFGKCIDIDAAPVNEKDFEGTWYVQYRPKNKDHYVHTCQATYDHVTNDNIYHSLLYYYNKGKAVNDPQHIKYSKIKPGEYRRGITVDMVDEVLGVNIKAYILDHNKDLKSRVIYYCADSPAANPNIFNVQIATRDMLPGNLAAVESAGKTKLLATSPKFDVTLMKVTQDKCEKLIVNPAGAEELIKAA